jgi:uncharacterized protein (DUF2267 family)
MSMTDVDAFDKSLNKTNEWLQDLMAELNFNQRKQAYQAVRATLQTLRDRLIVDEAVQLGSQLSMLVRGSYYEGWNPSRTPDSDKPTFLENVRQAMAGAPEGENPEDIARAVVKLLYHRISEGEIQDIKQVLPPGLEELWPRKMT